MIGFFNYYASSSFLHRRNPAIKLLAAAVMMLAVTLSFDPWTPLAFFVAGLLIESLIARVPLRGVVRPLGFFFVVGLLGFLGSNALFYNPPPGTPLTILWQAGPVHVSLEGIRVGVSLTWRMMAIVMFSMIFVTTTDPTDFVLSLIQQARFPFRLGYGVLVAYRFFPMWRAELDTIRAAHRIRGVGERTSLRGRWEQLRRYAIPLLASAIRKSERVAVAMDSKAFGAVTRRTYYRRIEVSGADWLMLAGAVLLTTAILAIMASAGLLSGFGVVPAA